MREHPPEVPEMKPTGHNLPLTSIMTTISIRTGASETTLILQETLLLIYKRGAAPCQELLRNVLSASVDGDSRTVKVAYLEKKKKSAYRLVFLEGQIEEAHLAEATKWAGLVMDAAYLGKIVDDLHGMDSNRIVGVKQPRRLMVLVNPHGGTVCITTFQFSISSTY